MIARPLLVLMALLLLTFPLQADPKAEITKSLKRVETAEAGEDKERLIEELVELKSLYHEIYNFADEARRAHQIYVLQKELHGERSLQAAQAAMEVGDALIDMGNPFRAAPLYEVCYTIREKELDPNALAWADANKRYGMLGRGMGTPGITDPYFRTALAIRLKVSGPDHPETVEIRHRLADLLALRGEFPEALELHLAGIKARETARGVRGLGRLHGLMGNYAQAEEQLRRAATLPQVPREKALSLAELGELLREVGDLRNSETSYREAHKIHLDTLTKNHVDTARTGEGLGLTLRAMGKFTEAEALVKHSYSTQEAWLGPEHPGAGKAMDNLAATVRDSGDLKAAKALFQTSEAMLNINFGKEHPQVARSRRELADVLMELGEIGQAGLYYRRALKVHRKTLGLAHPETVQTMQQSAYYLLERKEPEKALKLAREAEQGRRETLGNVFSFASERQRLRYYETLNPFDLVATLASAPDILSAALRYKGAVLDSVLEDTRLAEASDDPAVRGLVEKLHTDRRTLLHKLLSDAKPEEVAKLRAQVESSEKQLARNTGKAGKPRRALAVETNQVQNALPKGSVLVEFLRYQHHSEKAKKEASYGAVLLFPEGEPVWVPLGSASKVDKAVRNYQSVVRGQQASTRASRVARVSGHLSTEGVLREAYHTIWQPLEEAVKGRAEQLILSPDGQLNFLSFATLLNPEKKLLGETYVITYVSSGRDLLAEFSDSAGRNVELFGDPKFQTRDTARTPLSSSRSVGSESIEGVKFLKLPYTLVECKKLREMMRAEGYQPRLRASRKATERNVREVENPKILHLATHGFFLPNDPNGGLQNPMHRSGLALTGAQTTIEAWAARRAPEPRNDGILTAQEVGLLKLQRTWLVALSACDTGSGESRPGQGVLGLRRGFVQAGTRNLLMTLWPVADLETSQLMQDFYELAFKEGDAPRALAATQRIWLKRLRKERGLEAAVRLAGPFVMTFQGRP